MQQQDHRPVAAGVADEDLAATGHVHDAPGRELDRRLGDPGRVRAVGGGDLTSALQRAGHDAGVNDTNLRVALAGYGLAGAVFHGPLVAATPGMD